MKIIKCVIETIFRLLLIPFMFLSIPTGAFVSIVFIAVEYVFGFKVGIEKECKLFYYLGFWPFIIYEYYEDKYLSI